MIFVFNYKPSNRPLVREDFPLPRAQVDAQSELQARQLADKWAVQRGRKVCSLYAPVQDVQAHLAGAVKIAA